MQTWTDVIIIGEIGVNGGKLKCDMVCEEIGYYDVLKEYVMGKIASK